jgi:hypothetical protein
MLEDHPAGEIIQQAPARTYIQAVDIVPTFDLTSSLA